MIVTKGETSDVDWGDSSMAATRIGLAHRPQRFAATAEPVHAYLQGESARPALTGAETFFRLEFGSFDGPGADPCVIRVPLRPLGAGVTQEIWTGPAVMASEISAGVGFAATASHVVAHCTTPLSEATDISAATIDVYRRLIGRIRQLDYPYLVRMWNLVPGINDGRDDDETYVRFNAGRAAAFDDLGVPVAQYPAATAVGSPSDSSMLVIALASRTQPIAIENPRQTSAYRYPRRFGPRAPAFARATLLPDCHGARLLISGTASIVGHDSRHRGFPRQLRETFANLDRLISTAQAQSPGYAARGPGMWRIYLRRAEDLAAAADGIRARFQELDSVVFLQADLCRRELLVEIEGVCELAPREG